jgi:hypothetical protein
MCLAGVQLTPAKDRKAAERQRKKSAGLVLLQLWVKPEYVAEIKAFAADLAARLKKPHSALSCPKPSCRQKDAG